jgi:alpha-L-fucosidase 2
MTTADLRAGGVYSDVEYSRPGGFSLQFDAHVPSGKGPFPAAIIVHGGAWVTGDRRHSVEPLFKPLSDAGIAWFSISYRLARTDQQTSLAAMAATAALLGGAVDDVRSAVAYVRSHATEYNIDPNRIALIGESAGAQLAAMAALKPGHNADVQAVVAFYCPADLVALVRTMPMIPDSLRQAVRGTPFEELLLAHLRELSPSNWVRSDAPPFLLIHGTADRVVPYEQSTKFCSALNDAGSDCELYTVDGAGHGLRWWGVEQSYQPEMVRWLTQRFAKSSAGTADTKR